LGDWSFMRGPLNILPVLVASGGSILAQKNLRPV
jgi:hypothetical protein